MRSVLHHVDSLCVVCYDACLWTVGNGDVSEWLKKRCSFDGITCVLVAALLSIMLTELIDVTE